MRNCVRSRSRCWSRWPREVAIAGSAQDAELSAIRNDSGWVRVEVPLVRQSGSNGLRRCGSCLGAGLLGTSCGGARDRPPPGPLAGRRVSAGELASYAKNEALQRSCSTRLAILLMSWTRAVPSSSGSPSSTLRESARALRGGRRLSPRLASDSDAGSGAWLRENSMKGFLAEWAPTGRVTLVTFDLRPEWLLGFVAERCGG